MIAEVVLGQDDVLVVEDQHADDPDRRGHREAGHHAQPHADRLPAEVITQGKKSKQENERESRKHGGHRA